MTPPGAGLSRVDWPDFLSRHDPVWQFLPQKWGEGAFLGNGLLGAMIYSGGIDQHRNKSNTLRWEIGRVDVTAQGDQSGYLEPRVLIGDFLLEPRSTLATEESTLRLDLWNAELRGTLPCQKGQLRFHSFVHATRPMIVVELHGQGEESPPPLRFVPQHGVSPWVHYREGEALAKIPIPPAPVLTREGGVELCTQTFLTGGQCVVAWKIINLPDEGIRLLASIGLDRGDGSAKTKAIAEVKSAAAEEWEALLADHRNWWHLYYPKSFLSVPDPRVESFYWIQIYKLGSATRPDGPVLDILGPWMTLTPWPGVWWNLNVQLIYSPLHTANRSELAESLSGTLRENFDHLVANAPSAFQSDSAALGRASTYDCKAPTAPGWELGNLTFVCHNLWRHYRATMDEALLRDLLHPLLRRSINLYLHLLEEGHDGYLHLPATHSPEYGGHQNLITRDCNYDLALLRWGCLTLLEMTARCGLHDECEARWHEVLERLAPAPQDESGLKIGADLSLLHGHRHFSHLMSGYPLGVLDLEKPEDLSLFERSLTTWLNKEGALTGFSFTYAASAFSHLGAGDKALAALTVALDQWIESNTMYCEKGPVLETPLHAAEAIHNFLLQSAKGCIHIFPAVPSRWNDLSFANLRAEGAFLVCAIRQHGTTRMITIESLAGEPCFLRCDLINPMVAINGKKVSVRKRSKLLEIPLGSGDFAEIREVGDEAPYAIHTGSLTSSSQNFYGSPKPWRSK